MSVVAVVVVFRTAEGPWWRRPLDALRTSWLDRIREATAWPVRPLDWLENGACAFWLGSLAVSVLT